MSQKVLSYLQTTQDRDLETILDISKQYGIAFAMFPILLEAIEGTVVDCFMQGNDNKVSICYR